MALQVACTPMRSARVARSGSTRIPSLDNSRFHQKNEARGVHSHTEDEIIFVTDGEIRLGTRIYGPGTALAIAANTFYGFTAGPAGLRFVNFRARAPGDIRFANGGSMSETAYWRERLSRPEYVNT